LAKAAAGDIFQKVLLLSFATFYRI